MTTPRDRERSASATDRFASARTFGTMRLPSGKRLLFEGRPLVMGIVNVTPDSFSDGGRFFDPEAAVARGRALVAQGADLLDIGGESTRPGGEVVGEAEEKRRVLPVVERLARAVAVPLSLDTYKSAVAEAGFAAGADILNDVTALRADPEIARTAARCGAAVILMHATGLPGGFHDPAVRGAPLPAIVSGLREAVERAERAGVDPGRILIDPGIGFGKTQAENLALLRDLPELTVLGKPVVVGPSMKSVVARALDETDMTARAQGTAAAVAIAVFMGADVVRVHDVSTMRRVARVAHAIRTA